MFKNGVLSRVSIFPKKCLKTSPPPKNLGEAKIWEPTTDRILPLPYRKWLVVPVLAISIY